MSYTRRLKVFFLACVICFSLAARLAFVLSIGLFGQMGGLADVANELSLLIALLAACRLTERLKSYYAKRTVVRLMEAGWVKWTAQLETPKSAPSSRSAEILKMVA